MVLLLWTEPIIASERAVEEDNCVSIEENRNGHNEIVFKSDQ